MKAPVTVWSFTAGTLLAFAMLGWQLPKVLVDSPRDRLILMAVLWLLGLIAAVLVFVWRSAKAKAAPKAPAAADEIGNIMQAAKARLIAAKGKAGGQFGNLPLILVTGPAGAAKTTVITRAALEAELLSGEVLRGESVIPTTDINVWFAQNNLIVEAGGPVSADEGRWRRLVQLVHPNRAAAVMSRGKQAPRVAVVCFPCDEFLKPGASEAVATTAQKLRQRLADVSQQIGIRLPVYVIFTKMDRLPFFEDFFRSFTRAEAQDVLGATLPIQPVGNAGGYAEREARRLGDAFNSLFRGLAFRRSDILPRETQDAVKAGTYEFPREFRKISDLATQFLVDLCRPSQLGIGPFLRGFYFTGVRAVFKQDTAAAPAPMQAPAGGSLLDATSVFDPRMMQQAQMPANQPGGGTRKVPEWVFLDRVFRDVVLKDAVAQGVTAGGTKVTLWRRALMAAGIAALLVFFVGMTYSYLANGRLLARVRVAVEGARGLAVVGPVPDQDALQRLENLRVQTGVLDRYAREGAPRRLRWGLYAGNKIQPEVRAFYFKRFGDLLWTPTRTTLNSYLVGLPPTPNENSNYDATYDALKAALVTTVRPDSSHADFLAPVLSRFWSLNLAVDSVQRSLADSQFVFFANELPHGHPLPQDADTVLIERTRNFLRGFGNDDQLYGYLLAIARDSVQPFRWTHPTVRNDYEVKAEFTKPGWKRAQDALNDVPRLFARETWVVGESGTVSAAERSRLEQALRKRYAADYVSAWIEYLKAGRITGLASVEEAAVQLKTLANNSSPILRMIGAASDQTAGLDSLTVGVSFKPAHAVAAPNVTALTPFGSKYVPALSGFQSAVEQVANNRGTMREAAQMAANTSGQQVRAAITELDNSYDPKERAPDVAAAIKRLLESPLASTASAIGRVSVDELNSVGRNFCRQFESLARKFPFNRNSTTEAGLDEIAQVFAPNTGSMWTFHQENLQGLVAKTGAPLARPGANFQVNPAFADHFGYLARVSDAFFEEGAAEPLVEVTLAMNPTSAVPTISVNVGRTARYTQTNRAGQLLAWMGASTEAKIDAQVGNANVTYVAIPQSNWSIFRLFYAAEFERRNEPGSYQVTWRSTGQPPITGQLSFEDRIPVLDPAFLRRVGSCVAQIVR